MYSNVRDRVTSIEHWELLTLMLLTVTAIVGLYALGLLLVGAVASPENIKIVFLLGLGIAAVIASIQYWLEMSSYHEVGTQLPADVGSSLYEQRDRLAAEMDIEPPELRVVDDEIPNAFAVGRRGDGIVFFHRGIFDLLEDQELTAILAHEMSHLKNRDSAVMTTAASVRRLMTRGTWLFVTVTAIIVEFVAAALSDGGSQREAQKRARRRQRLIAATTAFVSGLVLVFSRMLSRYREYVADLTAARAIDDPEPVRRALRSLDEATDGGETVQNDVASSLYVVNRVDGFLARLFQSHPSIDRRIEVLDETFADDRDPSPVSEGAALGVFTKFGLTGAPVIIVATGLLFVAGLIVETTLGGIGALSGPVGTLVNLVVAALLVALLASVVAFPWAMLFATGGDPKYGFGSVVAILGVLFGGVLTPSTGLLSNLPFVGYFAFAALAALQLYRIARDRW